MGSGFAPSSKFAGQNFRMRYHSSFQQPFRSENPIIGGCRGSLSQPNQNLSSRFSPKRFSNEAYWRTK